MKQQLLTVLFIVAAIPLTCGLSSCKDEKPIDPELEMLRSRIWKVESWTFKNDDNPTWDTIGWGDIACNLDDRWEFTETQLNIYNGADLCNGQEGTLGDPIPYELTAGNSVLLLELVAGYDPYTYNIIELTGSTLILEYGVGDLQGTIGRTTYH